MEHAVDVTRIAVKIRVISSLRAVNVPLLRFPDPPSPPPEAPRCFSSSSANSRTFHGYNVVMAISAACNNANRVNIPNHMDNLETNSFVVKGTMGASGLRATIPPPACAGGNRKERKGSLDAIRSVRKADRIPRVLRSCDGSGCSAFDLLDVSNERVEVVVAVALVENLERMDRAALRAHRRGFRLRLRRDDVVAFPELFSAAAADEKADIDKPLLDPLLLVGKAAAIFECKSDDRCVDDDRCCNVAKAQHDDDDVRETGSLPIIRSAEEEDCRR